MPSIKYLDIKIFGEKEVMQQLFQGQQATANMKPVMEDVADDMMYVIGVNFSSQGRRGGGSWKRLSPDWVKRKAKKEQSPLILVATGALHDSMTQRGDPDQVLKVTRNGINLSSRLDYAEVPITGEPKRDYTQFLWSDKERWVSMCEEHILNAMSRLRR